MKHPFERTNQPITREQLLRRAAVGGVTLSLPGLLAACGGGGGHRGPAAPRRRPRSSRCSPTRSRSRTGPTTSTRTTTRPRSRPSSSSPRRPGVKVNYLEDINSNEEFFGEIQAPLSRGQSIDRDIIVPTAWLAARLLDLGYLQKLDKSAIPNIVNLEDTLASPAWDPNRDYSLPWQSYITGVGYDPKKVGGEITSVEQLLDPALKGKVTMLDSMEDTAALFLLEMGGDPADPDQAAFNEIMRELKHGGRRRADPPVHGQRLHGPPRRRRRLGLDRLVGGHRHPPAGQPEPRVQDPDAGGISSVDTMVIPTGGDVYTASTFMNFFYDPAIAAQVAAYVNYITPVKGTKEAITEIDPALAEDPLIFPTPEVLENLHEFSAEAIENPEYQEQWQSVIGV